MPTLLELLDPDPLEAERKYVLLRNRLIHYLERRACHEADELADEVFARIQQRTGRTGFSAIRNIDAFLMGTVSRVHKEWLRKQKRSLGLRENFPPAAPLSDFHVKRCLESCIRILTAAQFELVQEFSLSKKQREALAQAHGLKPSELRSRIFRYREKVLYCLTECLDLRGRNRTELLRHLMGWRRKDNAG